MQPTLEERILQLEVAEVNLKSNGRYLKWNVALRQSVGLLKDEDLIDLTVITESVYYSASRIIFNRICK